jgi:MFS family permease
MRRTTTTIYALLLVETLVSTSFVPLAPTFAHHLSLSTTETGAALAIANVPLLLTSALMGALSDRISGRSLTIAASAILAYSASVTRSSGRLDSRGWSRQCRPLDGRGR